MTSEKQERFIILRKIKYGESDLILHALSPQGSKVSFMARGAVKSKKRFGGGVLEPTHYVRLTYKDQQQEGKLRQLHEAVLLDDFPAIRKDYEKLDLALFVMNCASHVSQEGDVGSEFLFNLVGHTLKTIEGETNTLGLKLHFCLKFLYQQGIISLDPWMTPFLKFNISDHSLLKSNCNVSQLTEDYLDSIESLVMQYIKTADSGF